MKRILVVGEDALSVALGERLVAAGLPGWEMPSPAINTGGVTKLVKALPRSIEQSRHVQPVLCVADTDGRCAVTLLGEWLPRTVPGHFMLRLAVSEAESWILADRSALADFSGTDSATSRRTAGSQAKTAGSGTTLGSASGSAGSRFGAGREQAGSRLQPASARFRFKALGCPARRRALAEPCTGTGAYRDHSGLTDHVPVDPPWSADGRRAGESLFYAARRP